MTKKKTAVNTNPFPKGVPKKKSKAPDKTKLPFHNKSKIDVIKSEYAHLVPEDGYISIKKLWLFFYRINIYQIVKNGFCFGNQEKMVDSRFIEVIDTNEGWKIEEKHPS